jgi:predicted outer membrane repeat protein
VTSPVTVPKNGTVINGGGKITLDGGQRNRILVPNARISLSVRNLRFKNGKAAGPLQWNDATGAGGAIWATYDDHLEVIDSSFTGNTATTGGAIAAGDSWATIVGSAFIGNHSNYGGATYTLLTPLTVVNSAFTRNSVTVGGGGGAIDTDGAAVPGRYGLIGICGTTFSHNSSNSNGGAAYLWSYAPQRIAISRTAFLDNSGGDGGAARISVGGNLSLGGGITVNQTSVLSNTSSAEGGGFYMDCVTPCALDNDTFYNNKADAAYGGAVFPTGTGTVVNNSTFADNRAWMGGAFWSANTSTFTNTVFVGNSVRNPWDIGATCAGPTGKGAHDVQWALTGPDKSTACSPHVTVKNPRLTAPADNGGPTLTMMPAADSPLMRAGRGCRPVDQRGARRNAAVCDIGAVQRTAA